MSETSYRQASYDELSVAARLRLAMMAELDGADLDQQYPGWRQRFVEFYARRMRAGNAGFWLAEQDGQIAGMAVAFLLVNQRSEIFGEECAYLNNVYVVPQWRKRGIGSRLTQTAVAWARERGCVVVRLRASSLGRSMYAALGFVSSGEMELRLTPH
jgi:GNAT superfamily N-acetyltransferase